MKMQEVITQLRELAPVAAENAAFAETLMCELVGVMEDMKNATTLTACKAISSEAYRQVLVVQQHIVHATKSTKALQDLNRSYKEKLGPRGPKKPKDAPGQMDLFDPEKRTDSPASTPSFIMSGRHG